MLTSCEDFLDVNTDPNNPTEVTPDLILPVAQKYTASLIQEDRRINCLGNMMMYNWSQSDGYNWYTEEFKYQVTSSFYQAIFNDSYPLKLLNKTHFFKQLSTNHFPKFSFPSFPFIKMTFTRNTLFSRII